MNRFVWLCLIAFLGFSSVHAVPLTPERTPEPLKPWISWVLHDTPEHGCPFVFNNFEEKHCGWPTDLTLDLGQQRGAFSMRILVFQDSWVTLPGDYKHWPLAVTVNDKPAEVINMNGLPSLKLSKGGAEIRQRQTSNVNLCTLEDTSGCQSLNPAFVLSTPLY
jgi:hypothetical protein